MKGRSTARLVTNFAYSMQHDPKTNFELNIFLAGNRCSQRNFYKLLIRFLKNYMEKLLRKNREQKRLDQDGISSHHHNHWAKWPGWTTGLGHWTGPLDWAYWSRMAPLYAGHWAVQSLCVDLHHTNLTGNGIHFSPLCV